MRPILVFIALFFLLLSLNSNSQVVINEVMSANTLFLDEELDDTPDWIELFNGSESAQDLSGWHLSDNDSKPQKWTFPNETFIQPNSYLIIVANGEDELDSPLLQANFKLNQSGEAVTLSNQNLDIVDRISLSCIPRNRSFGRNAQGELVNFYVPSPAEQNIYSTQFSLGRDSIFLSHQAGLYSENLELNVTSLNGSEIYYSTDGRFPDDTDPLVSDAFLLGSQFTENGISHISSGPLWLEPQIPVFNGHTFKFLTFSQGCPTSKPVVADYYIRPQITQRFPVPVYSISFNQKDLFGLEGILVSGSTGENYQGRGDEWERRGYLQMFQPEDGLTIDQPIDIRVRGAGSRMNNQKSLKLYARDFKGKTRFEAPIFSDREVSSYKRLVLRSGHSDFTQTLIKDLLAAELSKTLDLEYMAAETSVVFMNGEYWGIQNARENMDEYYLESHFGVNPDSVEIIKFTGDELVESEGSSHHFQSVLDYAADNDLGVQTHYDWISEEIDLANFIDYHISELLFANWDWPKNNNKVWRSTSGDSKFRWMLYDCDACFYRSDLDLLTNLDNSSLDVKPSFVLLKNLLQNPEFRLRFQRRYLELIQSELSADRMIQKIDSLKEVYEPLIIEHIKRWSTPESYFLWKENLDEMRVFALQRQAYALNQLNKLFSSPVEMYPVPVNEFITVDTGIDQELVISVYNSSGMLLIKESLWNGSQLNLLELASGLYVMNIQLGQLNFTEKFIKN